VRGAEVFADATRADPAMVLTATLDGPALATEAGLPPHRREPGEERAASLAAAGACLPHPSLQAILLPAYAPCAHLGTCPQARWNPAAGHIPRGFLGATGDLADVELVLVTAEPGFPMVQLGDMDFSGFRTPEAMLGATVQVSLDRRRHATADRFHTNWLALMNRLWPGLGFDERLRRFWWTNARLCSIDVEIGHTPRNPCAKTYLRDQIEAFPHATVVAFGGKAQKALGRLGLPHLSAFALAPPGCNQSGAKPSWDAVVREVERRRASGSRRGACQSA
jgi:hypothetical protein